MRVRQRTSTLVLSALASSASAETIAAVLPGLKSATMQPFGQPGYEDERTRPDGSD
jgi:hypothetical protein